MPAARTTLAKLGFGAANANPVTQAMNFQDFDPGVRRQLRDTNGTRGTFDKDGNRIVEARRVVTPRFRSEPTRAELQYLLRWGLYGTPTGSGTVTYPLANDPWENALHFAPNLGEQWYLPRVAVDTFTLSGTQGEPLTVDCDCVGTTYDDTVVSFPVLTLDQTTRPFSLAQLAIQVGGVTRYGPEFSLTVRHNINRDRFFNSLTLTDLIQMNRQMVLAFSTPSGENPGFWASGVSGVTVLATFTNAAGDILSISAADVRFEPVSPTFPQGGEGMVRMEGELYRVASGSPITVTVTPAP
jgi:hypothetical protein